jgi:hypothetical protein
MFDYHPDGKRETSHTMIQKHQCVKHEDRNRSKGVNLAAAAADDNHFKCRLFFKIEGGDAFRGPHLPGHMHPIRTSAGQMQFILRITNQPFGRLQ